MQDSRHLVKWIRVERNRYGKPDQPWIVRCRICSGGPNDFFAGLFGAGLKGWAPTWRIAMDYADFHATEHEKTRCQTCLHVPEQPLPSEREASCQ